MSMETKVHALAMLFDCKIKKKNTRTPLNEPKYLNLFGAWNVRCRVNQQVQHYEKFLKMECQDRGELFALRTALGTVCPRPP